MAELLADGTKKVALTSAQFERVQAILQSFYAQTKCGVIMLSDESGLAIALRGRLDSKKMMLLSTVAAGNYAATLEMAKLVGEPDGFKVQFHEGVHENNIYVKGVLGSFFIVVVFGENTTFGMIRVLTEKTITELKEVLSQVSTVEEEATLEEDVKEQLGDDEFKDELSSRLSSILSLK